MDSCRLPVKKRPYTPEASHSSSSSLAMTQDCTYAGPSSAQTSKSSGSLSEPPKKKSTARIILQQSSNTSPRPTIARNQALTQLIIEQNAEQQRTELAITQTASAIKATTTHMMILARTLSPSSSPEELGMIKEAMQKSVIELKEGLKSKQRIRQQRLRMSIEKQRAGLKRWKRKKRKEKNLKHKVEMMNQSMKELTTHSEQVLSAEACMEKTIILELKRLIKALFAIQDYSSMGLESWCKVTKRNIKKGLSSGLKNVFDGLENKHLAEKKALARETKAESQSS